MNIQLRIIFPVVLLLLLGACTAVKPGINPSQASTDTPVENDLPEETPIPSQPSADHEVTPILKTISIGPQLVDCTGVAPQQCMRIKWQQDADWELFYDQILGFEFEPGFQVEMIVEERQVQNPPADASSLEWLLVEIISKTKLIDESQLVELGDTPWKLVDMGQPLLSTTRIDITFNIQELQVSGNGGCNNFFGGFTIEDMNISFGPMGSTMMACEQAIMDQEFFFLNLLSQTKTIEISGDQLQLITSQGKALIFNALAQD